MCVFICTYRAWHVLMEVTKQFVVVVLAFHYVGLGMELLLPGLVAGVLLSEPFCCLSVSFLKTSK